MVLFDSLILLLLVLLLVRILILIEILIDVDAVSQPMQLVYIPTTTIQNQNHLLHLNSILFVSCCAFWYLSTTCTSYVSFHYATEIYNSCSHCAVS